MKTRFPAGLSALLVCWSAIALAQVDGAATPTKDRPNIIIILGDDMGYSDLGCTGAEIETPHLDRLAREGVLFTHCYNTSRCYTPYRQGKSQEHEGGIITPLIVRWPLGTEKPDSLVHEPMHGRDADLPPGERRQDDQQGNRLDPLDGVDVLTLMEGGRQDPNRVLYWEHEGNRAVRRGHWKLVALHKQPWNCTTCLLTRLKCTILQLGIHSESPSSSNSTKTGPRSMVCSLGL